MKVSSQYNGPEESPGYLLWKVSSLWRRKIEAKLKPLGLTHPQFVLLASIGWLTAHTKDPVKQVEIARFAGLDPNTTSQVLRSLKTKQLINILTHDGRSKSPTLTDAGKKLLHIAMPIVENEDELFFAKISDSPSFLNALQTLGSDLGC